MTGSLQLKESDEALLIFERATGDEQVICAFNPSLTTLSWRASQPLAEMMISAEGVTRQGVKVKRS